MTSPSVAEPLLIKTERLEDLLTELDILVEENVEPATPRLSLYLPAGRDHERAREGRIHLGNVLSDARELLQENGYGESTVEALLDELVPLTEVEGSEDFWKRQSEGLAVFVGREQVRMIQAASCFSPRARLSTQWWLTPLLSLGANVDAYWLLSLARNEVRLFRGSRLGIREIALPPGTPRNFGSSAAVETRRKDDDPATETGANADRRLLSAFFAEVDRGVGTAIGERSADPLILAGVDHYLPLYESVNTYPRFSGSILSGNPERIRPEILHEEALQALGSEFIQSRKQELLKIHARFESEQIETRLDAILEAALAGRVAAIVAPTDECCWGRYERDQAGRIQIEELPSDDARGRDLYQEAAEESLRHGARLFYLESAKMPHGKSICAEMRY